MENVFPKLIDSYFLKLYVYIICMIHVLNMYIIGYGKTVSHVVIGLKTAKGTKQLKLDPSIYESLQKEKVEVGDVIYIEANSGAVKVKQLSFKCTILPLIIRPPKIYGNFILPPIR